MVQRKIIAVAGVARGRLLGACSTPNIEGTAPRRQGQGHRGHHDEERHDACTNGTDRRAHARGPDEVSEVRLRGEGRRGSLHPEGQGPLERRRPARHVHRRRRRRVRAGPAREERRRGASHVQVAVRRRSLHERVRPAGRAERRPPRIAAKATPAPRTSAARRASTRSRTTSPPASATSARQRRAVQGHEPAAISEAGGQRRADAELSVHRSADRRRDEVPGDHRVRRRHSLRSVSSLVPASRPRC